MLSCEEVSKLNSEKFERELSTSEKLSLKMHMLMCKHCKRFNNNLSHLQSAMKTFRDREK